ncbi:30S ribosomal protein S17 [Methylomagnum ishizawai]|uniref:30S ribosomal protein S17 n=1 Tax=Methylomagnum ishizawai TaxID=1760988 RepID=UPI001C32AF89|nr:30S ribosomal protein S17 [Methylomagnum ishizawai]BBL73839.1 30S ribosomal protein S17 [Methylomagnum ishizawai]
MNSEQKTSSTLLGTVVSVKMDKTICVQIERLVPHPTYKKYIRKSSTLLAHDEKNESREGDKVLVVSCRPISKRKVWKLVKIEGRDS